MWLSRSVSRVSQSTPGESDELDVAATASDGEVMAVRHRELPIDGLQFHPESVLTPLGPDLIRNFLEAA